MGRDGSSAGEAAQWMETDPDGPGPDDWIPVTLAVARDRSADGWKFTSIADVREAMEQRHLLGAVQAEGPTALPDRILARIAVHPDGTVATLPTRNGPVVAGPQVEEIISGMAHELKAVIVLDDQLAIGTAGVPLEAIPEHVQVLTEERRRVYCWPGIDRYVAQAAATGLKEPHTLHLTEDWTILASRFGTDRVLTSLNAATDRFPFVTLTRLGPERRIEYVVGRGPDDLRLMAWWGSWLDPLVDPQHLDPEARDLQAVLSHPRFGEDEMSSHKDLSEEQRRSISAALADRDGGAFSGAVGEALTLPPLAIRLIEQDPDDADPELVGEPVEAVSRVQLARAAMKELNKEDRPQTPLERTVERWFPIGEIVLGLFFLTAALLDFLPGPWWLWLALGLLAVGDAVHSYISDARKKRKAAVDSSP